MKVSRAVAGALLALYAALLGASMVDESPTTDEPVHLTRGLAYFWGPDTSLSWAHPPLGNLIAVLPIVLTAERVDLGSFDAYAAGDVGPVAEQLLSADYAQRRSWFFESRAMVSCLALLLALYIYGSSAHFFGTAVGLCALGFFVLHPALIGLGRSVTTDMAVTLAMSVAVGELSRFLTGGSRWRGAAAAAAVGAALSTKYTALALIPLASLCVVGFAALRAGRYRTLSLPRALGAACAYLALSAAAALLAVNTAYRFEHTGATAAELLRLPEPTRVDSRALNGRMLETDSILPKLPSGLPIPLPFSYVFGLSFVSAHDEGGHSTVFMGKAMRHGHPAYFPVLLLIKTPLVMLLALGFAAWVCLRRRGRVGLPAWLFGGYAIVFLLLAMRAGMNIGIRHILPMIPFLCVLAGLGAVHAWRALGESRQQLRQGAALAAGLSSLLGVAWSFPDYIADFNVLAGGRRGGERISVVGEEWGQDTQRLGRALRERGIRSVLFSGDSFIARLELARYGVHSGALGCLARLPDDTHLAVRVRERARKGCYRWSRERAPSFDVASHVFVYRTAAKERPL